ncbi:PREDICTED: Fc receptor-like protein 1 isoform X2 [Hipposideros armiger]|uniref:Fc receptor-like protein 1 isoform X2 n=1 Tax=Hipposideros armiger TaxID=186990 RepID=A0A8B7QQK0_HIPAR|nr:PREDICTED: Fc receptor-like protein 1 isoform X2 [Hipposideros armiger]
MLELHCEAQTGSPPILYRFYHEDVTLGSSSAPSGGGVPFSLSLTAEHSGNYCEANNGLRPQHCELVPLSVTGLTGSRSGHVATSVTGVLLSLVGLAAVALLFYWWLPGRAGLGRSLPRPPGLFAVWFLHGAV